MGFEKPLSSFPIDIVYLWCDGNDPALLAKRMSYLDEAQKKQALDKAAIAKGRFEDNDELRYALRSLEKYAPFVRNVFIVTDDQYPAWLKLDHPKLRLINHREIIPREYLPTFNSSVIEAFIRNIPGLSEHFLYANDDFFFGAEVLPELFFDDEGNPYFYGKKSRDMEALPQLGSSGLDRLKQKLFQYNYYYSNLVIYESCRSSFPLCTHHNVDAYRKSSMVEAASVFSEEYERLYPCRFRGWGTVNRFLPLFYDVARSRAKMRVVKRFSKTKMLWLPKIPFKYHSVEMPMDALFDKGARFTELLKRKICSGHFKLFCFNDTETVNDAHRGYFKKFMSEIFPEKSSYEI